MADLIDRGKLVDYIMESDPDWCVKPVRPIFDFISDMPSVDAVEVVRCKDCKHSTEWYRDKRRCFLWFEDGIDVFEDGYCSYGSK